MNEKLKKMSDVYNEFGINIHDIPNTLQAQMNQMVREIIKLRTKLSVRNLLSRKAKKNIFETEHTFIEAVKLLKDGKCIGIRPVGCEAARLRLFKPAWMKKDDYLVMWNNEDAVAISVKDISGMWTLVKENK